MTAQFPMFVWMTTALLGLGLFVLVVFLKVSSRLIPNDVLNIHRKSGFSESASARRFK